MRIITVNTGLHRSYRNQNIFEKLTQTSISPGNQQKPSLLLVEVGFPSVNQEQIYYNADPLEKPTEAKILLEQKRESQRTAVKQKGIEVKQKEYLYEPLNHSEAKGNQKCEAHFKHTFRCPSVIHQIAFLEHTFRFGSVNSCQLAFAC